MSNVSTQVSAELELQELTQFIYLMPVAVARFDDHGAVELLNPKAVQMLHDLDIDAGRTDLTAILDRICPGLSRSWRVSAGTVGAVMPPRQISVHRANRPELHLLVQLVRPDDRCTMLTLEDVTVMVEQERELARQRRRVGVLLEYIHGYCVVMLDASGVVSEWNPSIGKMLGFTNEQIVGQPLLNFVGAQEPAVPRDFSYVQSVVSAQGWCRLHAPWPKIDLAIIWGDCVIAPVCEGDGTASGYVAVIRDVTEEHAQTQRLVSAALTDPLTGLYNRRGLDDSVTALQHRQRRDPRPQTWIMVDIDHFKYVNDTYGHDAGDEVLKAVAGALRGTAREADLLARLGGEEFVVLLPETTDAVAAAVAERLRVAVERLATTVGDDTILITASFGVAQQGPEEDPAAALERADAALYSSKKGGRNRVTVSPRSIGSEHS